MKAKLHKVVKIAILIKIIFLIKQFCFSTKFPPLSFWSGQLSEIESTSFSQEESFLMINSINDLTYLLHDCESE